MQYLKLINTTCCCCNYFNYCYCYNFKLTYLLDHHLSSFPVLGLLRTIMNFMKQNPSVVWGFSNTYSLFSVWSCLHNALRAI